MMWPLLGLSFVAMTLVVERAWFWVKTNRPRQLVAVNQMRLLMRRGDTKAARALAVANGGIYGTAVKLLLDEPLNEALIVQVVEGQRSRFERFMPVLSTIITAAPMLGILGTVLGIISSFEFFG